MKSQYHFKFEELNVYQKAIEFGELVHSQIAAFPKIEDYRLSAQFARAANSISFNIAEGSGSSNASFLNYPRISRDSSREGLTATTKALVRNYITLEQCEKNRGLLVEINKMLAALMKHLNNKNSP